MGTMFRALCSTLVVALLFYAGIAWYRRVSPDPAEVPRVSDVLEELKADLGFADEEAADPDPGTVELLGDGTMAASRGAGDVANGQEGREGVPPGPRRTWRKKDIDKLRKDTRREISRRRRSAYKELRPLEQNAFRLKNESSGLRPHKPSRNASPRVQKQYEHDLQAYLDASEGIARELRKAVAEKDKAATAYAKLKEDSLLARRSGPDELLALALAYGISDPRLDDGK